MERKKEEKESKGKIKTHHLGYLGAQNTYYVSYIKGVEKYINKFLLTPIVE